MNRAQILHQHSVSYRFLSNDTSIVRTHDEILSRGREVLLIEQTALSLLGPSINEHFVAACEVIFALKRQLIISGIGKSGHVARKIAATFAATGTPAIFVHPSEAGHGDLGMVGKGDVLLVISNSGNTRELRPILEYAQKIGITIIGICTRKNSMMLKFADIPILLPAAQEACSKNISATTSTIMQLAMGDALALTVMDMRGVSDDELQLLHPSGSIGLSHTPANEIMRPAEHLPLVDLDAGMSETLSVMTRGCLGMAGVIDSNGALVGVITDGDLRRRFEQLGSARAHEVMSVNPRTIAPGMAAGEVLTFLNENTITAAFVVADPAAEAQPPLGAINIHDLLRHGLS